jgi:hypothetical protein
LLLFPVSSLPVMLEMVPCFYSVCTVKVRIFFVPVGSSMPIAVANELVSGSLFLVDAFQEVAKATHIHLALFVTPSGSTRRVPSFSGSESAGEIPVPPTGCSWETLPECIRLTCGACRALRCSRDCRVSNVTSLPDSEHTVGRHSCGSRRT